MDHYLLEEAHAGTAHCTQNTLHNLTTNGEQPDWLDMHHRTDSPSSSPGQDRRGQDGRVHITITTITERLLVGQRSLGRDSVRKRHWSSTAFPFFLFQLRTLFLRSPGPAQYCPSWQHTHTLHTHALLFSFYNHMISPIPLLALPFLPIRRFAVLNHFSPFDKLFCTIK